MTPNRASSRTRALWLTASASLLLASCGTLPKVGPNHVPPDPRAPSAWHEGAAPPPVAISADQAWWARFGDPVLDRLIADTLNANRDIMAAQADLRRARALRRVAAGGLGPEVTASGTAQALSQSENGLIPFNNIPGADADTGLFEVGFDARWEIDLFGGTRREIEAAGARAEASAAALEDIRLSLAAETARTYFELRAGQRRLESSRHIAELHRATRDLVLARLEAGDAAGIELQRAEAALGAAEAELPDVEAGIRASAYRLAVLAAVTPEQAWSRVAAPAALAEVPDLAVPPPAQVLAHRPDLRRAERQLAAEVADIGVAMADLYPRLSLFGSLGTQSVSAGDLLAAASLSLLSALSISVPVFNRGRIRANIEAEEAEAQASLARFEQTSQLAVQEMETALARYSRAREAIARRRQAAGAARRAAALTRQRLEEGLDPVSEVIDADRDLAQAEAQLAAAEAAANVHAVAVMKATGGAVG